MTLAETLLTAVSLWIWIQMTSCQINDEDLGYVRPRSRPSIPTLKTIEATCDANGMQITINFDLPFNGIIYSKGSYYTQDCVFVAPNSNRNQFSFSIPINACGTQSGNDASQNPPSRYIENTIIMQNDAMYQQMSDTARQVRCNWNSDFRNTITFSPFQVDMRRAIGVSFNGNDVTTAMSVQVGRGPFAPIIREGLVQIGDTLTLVVYLQTKDMTMDIQVLDCTATDGRGRNAIKLTEENGCVLKDKLISSWMKTRETQNTAAMITYAYLTAFKFPDDMTVNVQCNIQVCRGGCPNVRCGGLAYGEIPTPPVVPDQNRFLIRRTTPIPEEPVEEEGRVYGPRRTTTRPTTPTTTTTTTTPTTTKTTTTTTTTTTTPFAPPKILIPYPPVEETEPPSYARRTRTRSTSTTTTTTTTTTPARRIIPYGEEEAEVLELVQATRPTQRRRTVFDRKRRALDDTSNSERSQVPLAMSIRVISPADVATLNASSLKLSGTQLESPNMVCLNIVLFAIIIAVLFGLLIISCTASALLCVRQRRMSKDAKKIMDCHPKYAGY